MQKVNYISQLSEAISKFSDDDRLNSTHVSLYLALFQFWNLNRFKNPISINRSDAMRVSKIGSKTTYHRCINQLDKWGYIKYFPSNNPLKGSLVKMIEFQSAEKVKKSNKTQLPTTSPKEGQVAGQVQGQVVGQVVGQVEGQVLVPSTNSIKHKKQYKNYKQEREGNKNSLSPPTHFKIDESSFSKDELHSSKKSSRAELNSPNKNDLKSHPSKKAFIPPGLEKVKKFFSEQEASWEQAKLFFYHYEANGWRIGGKSKMENWEASAHTWILRDKKDRFEKMSPAQQRLHVNEDKDYSVPL